MNSGLDDVCSQDPPIMCLMCNSARKGDERLFMFGGNRPFMAKFETKLMAFIGRDKLSELQDKFKSKRDRSYICKHCYSIVDKTFDNIRKIQIGIARSVRKVLVQDATTEKEYESDQGYGVDPQANISKKKLPSVTERMAEKVASLTLVKINNRIPRIILDPVSVTRSSWDRKKSKDDEMSFIKISESHEAHVHKVSETNTVIENVICLPDITKLGEMTNKQEEAGRNETKSQEVHLSNMKELAKDSSAPLDANTSYSERPFVKEGIANGGKPDSTEKCLLNHSENEIPRDLNTKSFDSFLSSSKPSPAELAEILANPLLMVKSPQPVKLLDVKNGNVYICGKDGCDWIFSSRFFWENHIRHYHYYGRPHKCPFDGCNKFFPTKSKQKQHVRKHTGERPFICEECGKAFRGSQELRHHRGTHMAGKPYQCPKPDCYKSFKYINSMKRHLQFHDGNYPFPCTYPKCAKAFKNKYELKCHIRVHTGEKPYKCEEPGCGKAFRLPCEYTKHRRAHTGERPFKCTWEGCSAAYITCGGLASHMLSHSNDQHFCCEFCGKTFKHKLSYHSHLRRHTDPSKEFACNVEGCGKMHQSRAELQNHMIQLHGHLQLSACHKGKWKSGSQASLCRVTEFSKESVDQKSGDQIMTDKLSIYDYQNPLIGSTKLHSYEEGCGSQSNAVEEFRHNKTTGQVQCCLENSPNKYRAESTTVACQLENWDIVYESHDSLYGHMARTHLSMPKEKMCPICGQAFPHIQQLELHIRGYHEESSVLNEHVKGIYVCRAEKCDQRFQNADELKSHIDWHKTSPPYRCEVKDCRRTFLLEKVYNNHIQEHKNLRPHTCNFDGCTEGFGTQLKLLKHSKTHYGCFRCPISGCGKMLQAINSARIHLFRHTGEKPYACILCGRRFAACAQWIRHKRTHTGEKPYECDVCHTRFADAEILKVHKRSHTGEKPYRCEKCGQHFVSQATRRSHMRTHTGELPYVCPAEGCGKAFRESGSLKSHRNVHSRPSHLCSQCGKVYKFSISKHRCKVESQRSVSSQSIQLQPHSQTDCVHRSLQTHELQPPPSLPVQQHVLPPPQYAMNNIMITPDLGLSLYTTEMEEAARAGKNDYDVQVNQDVSQMQDADRNPVISSPFYNYMLLYDKPAS